MATVTMPFDRSAFARVRRRCLDFPETSETSSWGHPNFRAGRKIFCAFEIIRGRPSIAFRLPPQEVARVLRRKRFFATPYGRGSWASVFIDAPVDWKLIESLAERSYRSVAGKRLLALLDATTPES